jgi:phage-related protein
MELEEIHNNAELLGEGRIIVLGDALEYIKALNGDVRAKISADIKRLETGKTEGLLIKPLKWKIMELSVKQYRIIYFRTPTAICVVDVFKKQSRKTPLRFIKRAEKIYKKLNNLLTI